MHHCGANVGIRGRQVVAVFVLQGNFGEAQRLSVTGFDVPDGILRGADGVGNATRTFRADRVGGPKWRLRRHRRVRTRRVTRPNTDVPITRAHLVEVLGDQRRRGRTVNASNDGNFFTSRW